MPNDKLILVKAKSGKWHIFLSDLPEGSWTGENAVMSKCLLRFQSSKFIMDWDPLASRTMRPLNAGGRLVPLWPYQHLCDRCSDYVSLLRSAERAKASDVTS